MSDDPKMWPEPQPDTGGRRDLPKATKDTLAKYLSDITHGRDAPNVASRNAYPISATPAESALTTAIGEPAPFRTGPNSPDQAKLSFMDDLPEEAKALLEQYSNSGMFGEDPDGMPFAQLLDKNSQQAGNSLLADIKGQPLDSAGLSIPPEPRDVTPIQQKISHVLKRNRFSNTSDTPYIEDGQFSNKQIPNQGKFGVYERDNVGFVDENSELKDLFKVGLSMVFQATGHSNRDPTKAGAGSEAIGPSAVQLGISKVDVSRMRAENAFGAPPVARLTDSDLLTDVDGSDVEMQDSWGALNSPLETFAGFAPAGMVALTLTSMLVLIAGAVFFGIVISTIRKIWGDTDDPVSWSTNPPDLLLGIHGPAPGLLSALKMPSTNHDFEECVVAGIIAFYGLPASSLLGGRVSSMMELALHAQAAAALGAADNIMTGAGFYAGVIRQATRDPFNLESVAGSWTGMSLPGQGIINALSQVISSPAWKFLMTMAQIGNAVLDKATRRFGTTVPIEFIDDNAATIIAKSRVSSLTTGGKTNRLVWRHSNNRSRYLLPSSLGVAMTQLAGVDASVTDFDKGVLESNFYNLPNNRLSRDMAMTFESHLDAEYVPFYFQDLRTNEFLSFHAFISNISDSYNVDYTTVNAYGRVDPVMIYNKTDRTIAVDFILAATSPEDHAAMWWSINKLTTLLYPQWSKGRPTVSNNEKDKFIMPFSQIPTASPMVRLRLGDIIRGNYSKFNLARLFGAGIKGGKDSEYNIGVSDDPTWTFDDQAGVTLEEAHAALKEKFRTVLYRMMTAEATDPESALGELVSSVVPPVVGGLLGADPKFGYAKDEKAMLRPTKIRGEEKLSLMSLIGSRARKELTTTNLREVKIIEVLGDDVYKVQFVNEKLNEIPNPGAGLLDPDPIEYEWTVQHGQLQPSFNYITKEHLPQVIQDNLNLEDVRKFYSNDPNSGNAIVRSFESAMGRGLAGFIDSFSLDYMDSMWEVEQGARAPTMVKISIGFRPIHDIAPGLDSDGFNRAPVYNVGNIVNSVAGDQWGMSIAKEDDHLRQYYDALVSKITRTEYSPVDTGILGELL